MNIFFLDPNPIIAARYMCDKHVVKMIVESAQLLSTAHRYIDGKAIFNGKKYLYILEPELENILYKETHINHPCSIWLRENDLHYHWLYEHFIALLSEYNYRYRKHHKTSSLIPYLKKAPRNLATTAYFRDPPLAMPDEYKISDNAVESYRNYYRRGKAHLLKYTRRDAPYWLNCQVKESISGENTSQTLT